MRGRKSLFWAATAAAVMWAAFPAYGTQVDIKDAKDKVSSLEEEKDKVEAALKNLEGLKSDAAAYVEQIDANISSLNQEMDSLNEQISQKESEIAVTQEELEAAREVEEGQYESMKLRIKYMYEKGDTSYLDLLFESQSLSQMMNRAEYITQIAEYDRNKLQEYVKTKEEIAGKEARLETEHEELVALQESTRAKQAAAQQLFEEKQAELKNYESEISSAEGELSQLEQDIKAQEDRIKAIEAEIKRKEEEARKAAEAAGKQYDTVSIGNISFIWPCPSSSRITSAFGGRSSPTEGASTNHKGIDIGATSGSDILAAASGEVIISTYSYSAGNYIMINHGGGVYTVYMHCSQLLASVGQQVKQGDVIAKVGSTGYSTGPHLHFGIRLDGEYVNPSQYVSP